LNAKVEQLSDNVKAAKRALGRLEGVGDPSNLSPISRFLAGGIGGVVSQCVCIDLDGGELFLIDNIDFPYIR
jgi:hypothetical protein